MVGIKLTLYRVKDVMVTYNQMQLKLNAFKHLYRL